MEGDGVWYRIALRQLLGGALVFNAQLDEDQFKVALVTGYTPDYAAHSNFSSIAGFEVAGPGYTAGGAALVFPGGNVVYDEGGENVYANNVVWDGLDVGTPSHAILYKYAANDGVPLANKPLIACWEITTPTTGGRYTLQWNEAGMLSLLGSI